MTRAPCIWNCVYLRYKALLFIRSVTLKRMSYYGCKRRLSIPLLFPCLVVIGIMIMAMHDVKKEVNNTIRSEKEKTPLSTANVYKTSWFHFKMTNTEEFPLSSYQNATLETKRILYWTDDASGGDRYYGIGGLGADKFRKAGCPVWQCETYDYKDQHGIPDEDFDAIVFHDPTWYDRKNRPAKRLPSQRYVFWNQEAPGYHSRITDWNALAGFFNWTMTYRWDSDIIHPYGWFEPVPPTEGVVMQGKANHAEGKTKMAAWFVSNCDTKSGRNEYVRLLQKFIQVDVYGNCGPLKCPKDDNDACRQKMERDYKFAIAFENSLCLDYVTEKLYRQAALNVIPVVLDLHGNYARFAPKHSYINALEFPSVRHLADYLTLLDGNDTLYNEYFWWKDHYTIRKSEPDFQRGLCRLCSRLHGPVQPKTSYDDITDWWHTQAGCKSLKFPEENNIGTHYYWKSIDYTP